MAHDSTNSRIYVDTSVTPKKGVEIADLQAVLRSSLNKIGAIITAADINKWAKYKPIRSSKAVSITDAERVAANHGIVMTKYTSCPALVSGYANDYVYLKPRGRANNEWFRLKDLDGYNHVAESPVSSFQGISGDVTEGQDLIVRLYLNPSSQVPAGSLLWSDFNQEEDHAMSQYYFGVIIQTGNSSTYRVLTMGTPIGTGYPIQEMALTLPSSLFSVSNSYTLYPILSYTAYTSVTSQSSYTTGFYSVPDAVPTTFRITTIARVVSVAITDFSATVGNGRYTWSISASMQINAGTTYTGQILYRIYNGQYDQEHGTIGGDVVASGEFYYGQISIAPEKTYHTKSAVIRGTTPNYLTAVLSYQGTDYLPVTIEVL